MVFRISTRLTLHLLISNNPVSPPAEVTLTIGEPDRRTIALEDVASKKKWVRINEHRQHPVGVGENRKLFLVQIASLLEPSRAFPFFGSASAITAQQNATDVHRSDTVANRFAAL